MSRWREIFKRKDDDVINYDNDVSPFPINELPMPKEMTTSEALEEILNRLDDIEHKIDKLL